MDMKEIRRKRLKEWFSDRSLPTREKSFLSQLTTGKASFGERAARRIERDYGMPDGYLDTDNDNENKIRNLNPQHLLLIELFDSLTESEAEQLLKDLRLKKKHNDKLFEEMLKKRNIRA
ncbi:hypothetical protein [Symbiopectobacterium sp.]|uniref:hypothetical protein n=1 Tax=Symbiopectobacterium sp. TaxID=2952789 RepID=UPI003F3C1029